MSKPSGNTRLILKVKGPNCHMRGLHQKLSAHFGHGAVSVRGMERGICSVVIKTADADAVRAHLTGMGLRVYR